MDSADIVRRVGDWIGYPAAFARLSPVCTAWRIAMESERRRSWYVHTETSTDAFPSLGAADTLVFHWSVQAGTDPQCYVTAPFRLFAAVSHALSTSRPTTLRLRWECDTGWWVDEGTFLDSVSALLCRVAEHVGHTDADRPLRHLVWNTHNCFEPHPIGRVTRVV